MRETTQCVAVYAVLIVLLLLSLALTGLALSPWRVAGHLAIAAIQVALVFAVFMRLRSAAIIVRVMALGATLWLMILFGLTLLDYAHRGIGYPA